MPVHDCSGYTGFFIRGDDGEFHRFDSIPVMQTLGGERYDPAVTDELLKPDGITLEIALTPRSARRFRKTIHAAINSAKRKNRNSRRMAEKQRRKALKEGGYE